MIKQDEVKKALELFSKRTIKEARANLTRMKKNASRAGYNSLKYGLKSHKQSFSLEFLMEDYLDYQDRGVKGKKSNYIENKNTPFSFRNKRPPSSVFEKWIKQKGIKGRDRKTGRFISVKTLSFLIARSIYNKGIKGSMFFTRPFNNNFKKLPDELVEAFGLDVENFLTATTNRIPNA